MLLGLQANYEMLFYVLCAHHLSGGFFSIHIIRWWCSVKVFTVNLHPRIFSALFLLRLTIAIIQPYGARYCWKELLRWDPSPKSFDSYSDEYVIPTSLPNLLLVASRNVRGIKIHSNFYNFVLVIVLNQEFHLYIPQRNATKKDLIDPLAKFRYNFTLPNSGIIQKRHLWTVLFLWLWRLDRKSVV